MIRNKYRILPYGLYWLLSRHRMRHTPFDPMPSRREVNMKWKARLNANNKHTMGSES
jgi:hypothetical protein